jgi:hypothetical protein
MKEISDPFVKYHGESVRTDWERALAVYEVSRECSSFKVVRPLSVDIPAGTITYERLPVGNPLAAKKPAIINRSGAHADLATSFSDVGRILAEFHSKSTAGGATMFATSIPGVRGVTPEVTDLVYDEIRRMPVRGFHGDFAPENLWLTEKGEYYLIDPVVSRFCPEPNADASTIYYDIGHMASSIMGVYPVVSFLGADWSFAPRCVEHFVGGYEEASGLSIDKCAVFYLGLLLYDAFWSRKLSAGRFSMTIAAARLLVRSRRKALLEKVSAGR